MDTDFEILKDACAAVGIKTSDVQEYRVSATAVRFVAKDGRAWALELVRFNPEAAIHSEAIHVREAPQPRKRPTRRTRAV